MGTARDPTRASRSPDQGAAHSSGATARNPCVLIVAYNAAQVARSLRSSFPEVRFIVAASLEEADSHWADADVAMAIEVPADLATRAPRLRWVQALIAGVDRFEAVLAERPDVLLTSARGIHGVQMSEMVLMHMLALTRQLPRIVQNQERHLWEQFDQPVLDGKTATIVGMGTAGQATARLCRALGMTVHAVSKGRREVESVDRLFDRSELAEAAAMADYLVLTVAHTAGTERLLDRRILEAMKPGAYLINVSRGAVIDEAALADALHQDRIAGAGIDVVLGGQLEEESPLWDVPKLLITPHLGGRSDRYAEQLLTVVEPNLERYLAGDANSMANLIER